MEAGPVGIRFTGLGECGTGEKLRRSNLPLALSGFHLPAPRGTGQTLPSLSRPLPPTESQIVALREEEEESQSQSLPQPTSNQPGGTINDSATSDPLPPTVRDAKDDIQPTKPNVNNGRSSEPSGQGAYSQSNVPDPIMQVSGVTDDSPGYPFNPLLPSPMSLLNPNPSASANSSSKSPQQSPWPDVRASLRRWL